MPGLLDLIIIKIRESKLIVDEFNYVFFYCCHIYKYNIFIDMNLQENIHKIKDMMGINERHDLLNKPIKDIIDQVGGYGTGFNTDEDAIEEIEYVVSSDFPEGLNNIPTKVILYRVILLEDGKSINEDQVGEHFISDPRHIDRSFLEKIDIWDNWDADNSKLWLLQCETDGDNIDIERTIGNRIQYPRENEFTLKNDKNIRLIKKKILNKEQIR